VPLRAGNIASSLEQFNYQTGPSGSVLRSYDAFDEISGADEFPGVTGLTVQVNGGPVEHIAFDPFYAAYKRRHSWDTVAEMVATRPIDATIVQTLQGSPAGAVTITAPGVAYADGVPVIPLFEISGVSGYWTYNPDGQGIFNFDPALVSSFTISMNGYAASVQGLHFFYGATVADVSGPFTPLGVQHSGLLAAGAAAPPFSMTFTRGLPLDGGDADVTTYGFAPGSFLYLEGEFGNVFAFEDAGLGEGSTKAFVYQNNTSLLIHAVPEPSILVSLCVGVLLLVGGVAGTQRTL
jgi:hypothetical protein